MQTLKKTKVDVNEKYASTFYKKKKQTKKYILRILLVAVSLILALLITLFSAVTLIAHGPSVTLRDTLVLSAMQASATKWVPYLFLPSDTVKAIIDKGSSVTEEVLSINDYYKNYGNGGIIGSQGGSDNDNSTSSDEWADSVGGIKLITQRYGGFEAYILLVRDPSRIFVGTSSDFTDPEVEGMDIFDLVKKEGCIAAINGGEFSDPGGVGTGNNPLGITYSKGSCVWDDKTYKTFIGIDENNRLVCEKSMSQQKAEKLGIRDGVCFKTGNVLISNDGTNITLHRQDSNYGTAQRTAIGQRADGTMIMLVTDGRTPESPGATYNEVINIMVQYGAITAGMLDGGSSTMLYYDKYWEKYEKYNYDQLDRYQKKGLVNNYKAFTMPRQIPTFFCVAPEQ